MRDSFAFITEFEGVIPGSRREGCGNFLEHDLPGAKSVALDMLSVLENWKERDLQYPR